jgi:hypothetical protein
MCKQRLAYLFILLFSSSAVFSQLLPSFGDSRTGGSGMQFLKISPDARGMAMGGAAVATADDASAMYWNPAAITHGDTARVKLLISNTQYFGDIQANYIGTVIKAGPLSYVGISAFSLNYGDMKETTEFEPFGTGRTFNVANYNIGLTYARILTDNFSFGLNGKFAQESFAGINVNNVLFDLGLKYNVGVKHARFGINFSNFGLNIKPGGSVQILKFDGVQDINTFSDISVPAIFRIGAAFDPIHNNDHILSLSAQLNHPTDNNETYAIGAEYSYLQIGYLRAGYEFGSDDRFLFPSFGMGVKILRRFGGFVVDYGILPKNNLGNVHRISLGILLI